MKDIVVKLHEEISSMSLGDLCLLAGQAINMGMERKKVDIILSYLEVALIKHSLEKRGE